MTIAMLMANTVTSAYLAAGRKRPVLLTTDAERPASFAARLPFL